MFGSVLSAAILGVEVCPVRVEADVNDGLPSFSMVGYVSSQVKEAQDRVRTALRNMHIVLPPQKIVVNLAPADIRKEGAGFDLPVAGAVLAAMGYLPGASVENILMMGELSLNGEVQGVSGVLPVVMKAKEMGCRACIIPRSNLKEGQLVKGIPVIGINNLEELLKVCSSSEPYQENEEGWDWEQEPPKFDVDFADIRGQEALKHAAVIAAGGLHNLLLIGAPGSGKTMAARRFPTILPALTEDESLEITRIYSIAGLLPPEQPVIRIRPFRAPHHTISPQALAGGGRIPKPGEITLAHRGVLFMDEMPEFSRRSLEILRQPLEDRCIQLSRVNGSYLFPANLMLVAAMNPCPCGFYPDMERCTCTAVDVLHYQSKISFPLLDRIDMCLEVPSVTYEEMTSSEKGETSAQMRRKVEQAREIQRERYEGTKFRFNSDLTPGDLHRFCPVTPAGERLLRRVFQQLGLSARGYHRVLKVARTLADMEKSKKIGVPHISEALGYRMIDKGYWNLR